MWRATIKSLLARRVRLMLTTLSVVLGVGFVAGTFVLTDTMTATFDQLFRNVTADTDVLVRSQAAFQSGGGDGSTGDQREPMPASIVQRIESVDGVASAVPDVEGYAQIVDPATGKAIGSVGPPTIGTSWDGQTSGVIKLRDGAAPRGTDQVAIDAATAGKYGISVGERVEVLFEGPSRTFTVSGVVGIGEADNLAGATLAIFDLPTTQDVLGKQGLADDVSVKADPRVSATALRDRIAAVLPKGTEAITASTYADEQASQMQNALGFFRTALLVFAIVALFVGGFIILNTFTIIVTQRTRELALLRAMGASRRQVMLSVLLEAAVVGLVAGAIGVLAGIGIATGLQALLKAFGIDLPSTTTQVLPRTVIVSLIVGLLVTVVASIAPARRASTVAPIEAMRENGGRWSASLRRRIPAGILVTAAGGATLGYGLVGGGALLFVGIGAAITFVGVAILSALIVRPAARAVGAPLRVLGVPGRLGAGNAMRNPRRTASTAGALMVGLGLMAFVAIFGASVRASTDRVIADTVRADLFISSSSFNGFGPQVAQGLRSVPQIDAVFELRMVEARIGGDPATVTGVDPATIGKVAALEVGSGSIVALDVNSILVQEDVAAEHGWSVGDQVSVRFARTGTQTFEVAGTYARDELVGSYVISMGAYEANVTEQLDQGVLATAVPGTSVADAQDAAERALADFPNVEVRNQAQFRQEQASQIDGVMSLISALLLLAVVISLFGIVNTLGLSIHERRHEIGLLRAVGMSRRQVRRMVLSESVIVALLGALLGTGIGLFFGWAVQSSLAGKGITQFVVPGAQLAQYVGIAALAGLLAGFVPAVRAARLRILDAIAYE
jgi:putative ABC transport system permease protein